MLRCANPLPTSLRSYKSVGLDLYLRQAATEGLSLIETTNHSVEAPENLQECGFPNCQLQLTMIKGDIKFEACCWYVQRDARCLAAGCCDLTSSRRILMGAS